MSSNVVDLHGQTLIGDPDFLADFARFSEGILDKKFLKTKYRFSDQVWKDLGNDARLLEAIELESVRRMRNGDSAREKAQQLFVGVPTVLGGILHDDAASPRHRIESAKELRTISAVGPEAVPRGDRFIITINLGADGNGEEVIEHYNKAIKIGIGDGDPVLQIATTEPGDGDDGSF